MSRKTLDSGTFAGGKRAAMLNKGSKIAGLRK